VLNSTQTDTKVIKSSTTCRSYCNTCT